MMIRIFMVATLVSSSAVAAIPALEGWKVGPDSRIIFTDGGKTVYSLDCSGPGLVVTQFGVTRLVDLQRNRPVGDTEIGALPEGAAVMALATDEAEPDMVPASAVRSAGPGWDMTIRLPTNDPAFLSLPRAAFVSLFTTGFTRAVELSKSDRKMFAAFVSRCRAKFRVESDEVNSEDVTRPQ